MKYEFDPKKSKKNEAEASRGFGFELSQHFDWDTAVTQVDNRRDYGETRYISYGIIFERLHVMVWTPRNGRPRVISLRKANAKERNQYEKEKTR